MKATDGIMKERWLYTRSRGTGTTRKGKQPDPSAPRGTGRLFPCPWQTSQTSPAASGNDGSSAVYEGESPDDESPHGGILKKYNELLSDATTRLATSLERLGEEDADTGPAGREMLIQKIRELIDYLDGARL
jgi:hypothetical protein